MIRDADTDFDAQLRAMLTRRAADIKAGPQVSFSPASTPAAPRHRPLAVAAAAAAVLIGVGTSIVAIDHAKSGHGVPPASPTTSVPAPSPVATPTGCVTPLPAEWRRAITAGRVAVDQPLNLAASVDGATGEALVVQGTPATGGTQAVYGFAEVALFNRDGHGGNLWKTTDAASQIPVADASAAISSRAVAFAVAHPQSDGTSYSVVVYDRAAHIALTPVRLSDAEYLAGHVVLGAPVVLGATVYWLRGTYHDPKSVQLQAFDLNTGHIATTAAADATGLTAYGSGVAFIGAAGGLTNGAGRPLAPAVIAATAGAGTFAFDGTDLSWVVTRSTGFTYYSAAVASGRVQTWPASGSGLTPLSAAGPVLPVQAATAAGPAVLDLRGGAGAASELPAGTALQAGGGDLLVFGIGDTKSGAGGLSFVSTAQLPRLTCH